MPHQTPFPPVRLVYQSIGGTLAQAAVQATSSGIPFTTLAALVAVVAALLFLVSIVLRFLAGVLFAETDRPMERALRLLRAARGGPASSPGPRRRQDRRPNDRRAGR